MKRALPIVIAVLLAWSLPAWAQDLKALVTQMQSQDAAQRATAVDAIAQVGPSALPALFDLLEGEVPDADEIIPLGKAATVRAGSDVTVVAYSRMVHEALAAAETLAAEGIEAEVIDLRTLSPMDSPAVIESVKRTGRAILVEEGPRTCGVMAELAARIAEEALDYLDGPVTRLTMPDIPVPCSPALERAALPSRKDIVESARKLCG